MKSNFQQHKREYLLGSLDENNLQQDPFRQLNLWIEDAYKAGLTDHNAMVLSTVSTGGLPSSRTVLLKELNHHGLEFYTNYESEKGQHIAGQPHVSLLFLWLPLERQVRIKGIAEKLPPEASDKYFALRKRETQLGAWTSLQSKEIKDRNFLEEKFKEMKKRFRNSEIPRPDYWGGYLVSPLNFEFWQGRPNRLNDRIVFEKQNGSWKIKRLAP